MHFKADSCAAVASSIMLLIKGCRKPATCIIVIMSVLCLLYLSWYIIFFGNCTQLFKCSMTSWFWFIFRGTKSYLKFLHVTIDSVMARLTWDANHKENKLGLISWIHKLNDQLLIVQQPPTGSCPDLPQASVDRENISVAIIKGALFMFRLIVLLI